MPVVFSWIKKNVRSTSFQRAIVVVALLFWYGFFLFHQLDLITADLGRHLKNGEIILSSLSTPSRLAAILHTNFYSYVNFAFPFINHHWGSGVLFFIIWSAAGLTGLSLFFILLSIATFLIFFCVAYKNAGLKISATLAFFLIPLLAERVEIRPEIFSYLFAAIFFWLLSRYRASQFSSRYLYLLPILELVWVNLHIYFFLGPLLLGLFLLNEIFFAKPKRSAAIKKLALLLAGTVILGFVNPFGPAGFFYPLRIFNNYGFRVSENQSVSTLSVEIKDYANLLIFKFTLVSAALIFLTAAIKKKISFINFSVMAIFGLLAWTAVRNFTLFALFALPAITETLKDILPKSQAQTKKKIFSSANLAVAATLLVAIFLNRVRLPLVAKNFGLGVAAGNADAGIFLRDHHIAGPLFNDFDIGSYAIFYLYPQIHPFVDNRPEAYPTSFFQNIYVPLHTDEASWKTQEKYYGFNTILYSFEDKAPWALPFIVKRLEDPSWAPVYAGQYAIVFLKRNEQNAELIKNYEIPKERFTLEGD